MAVGAWAVMNFSRLGEIGRYASDWDLLAALLLPMVAIVAFGMGLGILVGRPRMGLFALVGVVCFAAIVGAVRLAVVLFR
jgi:hypothetical protein